jgi:hypothetical protein
VIFTFDNGDRFVHQMESHDAYPGRGRYPTERWFAGPFVPGAYDMAPDQRQRQFPTLCGFCREGDLFLPTGYDFDDQPGHWALAQPWLHQVRMFAGDAELELRPLSEDFFGIGDYLLPPEPATYRLEDRSEDPRGQGRQVRTTWTFHSAGRTRAGVPAATVCVIAGVGPDASCRYEPLINLRYDLGVSLDNTVPGGRPHVFRVVANHHSQASPLPVSVDSVALSYDDGATWLRAPAVPLGHGGYLVTAGQPVRLRVDQGDRRNGVGRAVDASDLRAGATLELLEAQPHGGAAGDDLDQLGGVAVAGRPVEAGRELRRVQPAPLELLLLLEEQHVERDLGRDRHEPRRRAGSAAH